MLACFCSTDRVIAEASSSSSGQRALPSSRPNHPCVHVDALQGALRWCSRTSAPTPIPLQGPRTAPRTAPRALCQPHRPSRPTFWSPKRRKKSGPAVELSRVWITRISDSGRIEKSYPRVCGRRREHDEHSDAPSTTPAPSTAVRVRADAQLRSMCAEPCVHVDVAPFLRRALCAHGRSVRAPCVHVDALLRHTVHWNRALALLQARCIVCGCGRAFDTPPS
jgi:hypothetical protein